MSGGFDTQEFRKALGSFVTGVTVVTTREHDGTPRGFTANSFTSVSLDPPLVLVCIAKSASSFPVFAAAPHFAVNVLAEAQKSVSALFASKRPDKFEAAEWAPGPSGSPQLSGTAAWFDCRTHDTIDAGDHLVLIGRVTAFDHQAATPLGYGRGAYLSFGLSQEAVAAAGQTARVGAILESGGEILLVETPDGRLDLPAGARLEPRDDPASLRGVLDRLGVSARLDFLFAVFEAAGRAAPQVSIYYRGGLGAPPPAGGPARLVPLDAVPYERLPDEAIRTMLRRFVRERRQDAFGIYVGDSDKGDVHPLARRA